MSAAVSEVEETALAAGFPLAFAVGFAFQGLGFCV